MKIIALDLGSHIGWAQIDPYCGRTAGMQTFTGDRKQRAGKFSLWLRQHLAFGPDVVIYERPFARGQAATRALWGLAGIIEAEAENAGAACLDVTPATIKQHAAGSGKADKDAMTVAASAIWQAPVTDEHMADAICLLDYAEKHIEVERGQLPGTRPPARTPVRRGEGTEGGAARQPDGGQDQGSPLQAPEPEQSADVVDDECLACQ